jgi:transcriptional regulator with XRE-family HTH domain
LDRVIVMRPKEWSMQLAKRLRELIRQHDLTVAKLSKRTSIPVNTLHNWLSGQPPRNIAQVKSVADFLNVSVDFLVFGKELNLEPQAIPELLKSGQFEIVLRARAPKRES